MANTIDLTYGSGGGIKYALDGLWKLSFGPALYICCGVIAALLVVLMLTKRLNAKKGGISIGILAAACLLYQIPAVASLFSMVTVPMVTFLVVGLLCLFNVGIMKTRIGQQFRAVGQNRTVANASGIHVDHVRVIAIMISTVLAGWGQLIFVQNMGTFQTYGAHEQVGLYAGAAILVGGASIRRATNGQALLGCILFHLLFIVTPPAAQEPLWRRGDRRILPRVHFLRRDCAGAGHACLEQHPEETPRKRHYRGSRGGGLNRPP